MLTNEQYVEIRGGRCPFCESDDIVGGSIDHHGDTLTQEIFCQDCHKEWSDIYKLAGYDVEE